MRLCARRTPSNFNDNFALVGMGWKARGRWRLAGGELKMTVGYVNWPFASSRKAPAWCQMRLIFA